MTPNGVATLFSRLDWLWPDQAIEKEQGLFETWLIALRPVQDDEVFEAVPLMATTHPRRPSVADIVAAARVVRAGRPAPLALPEPRSTVPLAIRRQVRAQLGMRPPEDDA